MSGPDQQRAISLEAHRIAEMALGVLLIFLPVVLNFEIAGFIFCAGPGALVAGLGIAATREGRQLAGVGHRATDLFLIALMIVAAVVSASLNTNAGPIVTLVAGAAVLALLTATTDYAEDPERKA